MWSIFYIEFKPSVRNPSRQETNNKKNYENDLLFFLNEIYKSNKIIKILEFAFNDFWTLATKIKISNAQ